MCESVGSWSVNYHTLADNSGSWLAHGTNEVDFYTNDETIGEACIACFWNPVREIANNCISRGDPVDHIGFYITFPYPKGVQQPSDPEDGGSLDHLGVHLGWQNESIVFSFAILDIRSATEYDLRSKLVPFLDVHGAELLDVSQGMGSYSWFEITIKCPSDMLIREAGGVCLSADIALRRTVWDIQDPMEAFTLVSTGEVDRMLGARESLTIEAKSAHYSLTTERQKFEFAADLASFANSDHGGLILLGVKTKKDNFGLDVIEEIVGCEAIANQIDRYYSIAENLIVPPVRKLRMEAWEFEQKNIVTLLVPPQRDTNKPFLLKVGVVDGAKVTSSAFSIPMRSADRKTYVTAERVQAMLSSVYPTEST